MISKELPCLLYSQWNAITVTSEELHQYEYQPMAALRALRERTGYNLKICRYILAKHKEQKHKEQANK